MMERERTDRNACDPETIAVRDLVKVAGGRDLSAIIRADVTADGGSQARPRLLAAKMRGVLAVHAPQVAGRLTCPPHGFTVACGLILIRRGLVVVRGRLVGVGGRLVPIGGRLVAVGDGLVARRSRLVSICGDPGRLERIPPSRVLITAPLPLSGGSTTWWIYARLVVICTLQQRTFAYL